MGGPGTTAAGLGLGTALAMSAGDARIAPALFVLGVLLVAVVAPDLRERRIPDRALSVAAPFVIVSVVAAGLLHDDLARVVVAVSSGVAVFGALLLVAVAFPGGLGMGDVKLATLASVALGWFGAAAAAVAIGVALATAWVVGAAARRTGRWSTGVPFAPFYAVGVALTAIGIGAGLGS